MMKNSLNQSIAKKQAGRKNVFNSTIKLNFMQKIKYVSFLLVFCGLIVSAQASKKFKKNDGDKEKVALAIDELSRAMVNRDRTALQDLMMEELTYGHSSGKIENKQEFIDAVVNGDFDFISINTEEQTIFFSGDDTAVARHMFHTKAVSAGKPVDIRIGNMIVLRKQKGQWKFLARQAYKL